MSVMGTRPRGRPSDSYGPSATRGVDAVDEYLLALDDAEFVDARSMAELERAFVLNAKLFAERRGVSFAAWRDVGVAVEVLERAGIYEVAVGT
jgi:hypothetical protein